MTRPFLLTLLLAAFAALVAACGSPAATEPAPTGAVDVTLSANNNTFDKTSLTVPAGRAFTIGFTNQESSPHNVTIARDASFSQRLFEGEVVQNRQIMYSVPALEAGTYAFRCDVHPFMAGTVTAQ